MDQTMTAPNPFGVDVASATDLPAIVEGMVGERVASGPVSDTASTVARCPEQPGDELGDITWRGVPAIVFVLPDIATRDEAVVVDASSCAVLATAGLT
jgi:hypothetical protein